MRGSTDEMVLEKASSEERILVTDDKDFGELIFRLNKPTSGLILLRTATTNPEKRIKILLDVIEKQDVEGSFTTIREDRIKIRKAQK